MTNDLNTPARDEASTAVREAAPELTREQLDAATGGKVRLSDILVSSYQTKDSPGMF